MPGPGSKQTTRVLDIQSPKARGGVRGTPGSDGVGEEQEASGCLPECRRDTGVGPEAYTGVYHGGQSTKSILSIRSSLTCSTQPPFGLLCGSPGTGCRD